MSLRPAIKHWRESASIIALAKNAKKEIQNGSSNYRILLQQRSDKSGFLPSSIVFPGGTVERCDGGGPWEDHFKAFGLKKEKFMEFHSKNILLPPILQDDVDPIKRHVSLRITAIRETFEELGILICKQRYDEPLSQTKCASYLTDFDIKYWQKKVHKDPQEFLSLCQQLDCYPDIWSLFLWSNWLTPLGYENQRFDTIFFVVGFDTTPPINADNTEVSKVWWGSPEEVMKRFETKEFMLPPPQWYEMSRFSHQKNMEEILKFSAARSCLGCDQIYPILIQPKNGKGHIAIFPGDELYPKEPDFYKKNEINIGENTLQDLQNLANITHRMEVHNLYKINVFLKNYSLERCQLSPVDGSIPDLRKYYKYPPT